MGMFRTLMRELDSQEDKSQTMIDLTIIRFFINFWRDNQPMNYLVDKQKHRKKGKYSTVYGVCDYLSDHFCEKITLEQLAEKFFVSSSYLSRSFKDVVGFGLKEYVNILRIRMAQEMLESSSLSISEISEAVGFETASYFGQVFQKHLAISPSQYRKDFIKMNRNDS